MKKQDHVLFNQFCKATRYYGRALPNEHHYAVRTPRGTFLTADDTEALFNLYEAAVIKESGASS